MFSRELAVSALKSEPVPKPSAELGMLALAALGNGSVCSSATEKDQKQRPRSMCWITANAGDSGRGLDREPFFSSLTGRAMHQSERQLLGTGKF